MPGDPLVPVRPLLEPAQQRGQASRTALHEGADSQRAEVVRVAPPVERVEAARGWVPVVEEEHAARPERRGDAASTQPSGVPSRSRQPAAQVDEIPVAEQELRRQGVWVHVHPRHLGRALP